MHCHYRAGKGFGCGGVDSAIPRKCFPQLVGWLRLTLFRRYASYVTLNLTVSFPESNILVWLSGKLMAGEVFSGTAHRCTRSPCRRCGHERCVPRGVGRGVHQGRYRGGYSTGWVHAGKSRKRRKRAEKSRKEPKRAEKEQKRAEKV